MNQQKLVGFGWFFSWFLLISRALEKSVSLQSYHTIIHYSNVTGAFQGIKFFSDIYDAHEEHDFLKKHTLKFKYLQEY